jgi:hypothetical protein
MMKRYLIERNIPGVDKLNREQLKERSDCRNQCKAARNIFEVAFARFARPRRPMPRWRN